MAGRIGVIAQSRAGKFRLGHERTTQQLVHPKMKDTLQLGMAMWNHLAPAFKEATKESGMVDHKERAQVWAAFLSAASGGMMHDLGKPDALTILEGVLDALRQTSHLQVVPANVSKERKC